MSSEEKKFVLVIYIPKGDGLISIYRDASDQPFPTIQKGDLLDSRDWITKDKTFDPSDLFVVTEIYHRFSNSNDRFETSIFTEKSDQQNPFFRSIGIKINDQFR